VKAYHDRWRRHVDICIGRRGHGKEQVEAALGRCGCGQLQMRMSRVLFGRTDAELRWGQSRAAFVVLVTMCGMKRMVGQTRPGERQSHQQREAEAGKQGAAQRTHAQV
jgi:hypothetical protein